MAIDNEREQAYRARRSSFAVSRRHARSRETGSEDRFCYTAPKWPRAAFRFAAWIHPLNLASEVLSFKSQYSAGPAIMSPNFRARLAVVKALASLDPHAGCGLDDDSVERTNRSYVMAGLNCVLEAG